MIVSIHQTTLCFILGGIGILSFLSKSFLAILYCILFGLMAGVFFSNVISSPDYVEKYLCLILGLIFSMVPFIMVENNGK